MVANRVLESCDENKTLRYHSLLVFSFFNFVINILVEA